MAGAPWTSPSPPYDARVHVKEVDWIWKRNIVLAFVTLEVHTMLIPFVGCDPACVAGSLAEKFMEILYFGSSMAFFMSAVIALSLKLGILFHDSRTSINKSMVCVFIALSEMENATGEALMELAVLSTASSAEIKLGMLSCDNALAIFAITVLPSALVILLFHFYNMHRICLRSLRGLDR